MTKAWENPDMKKATVTIEAELYERVKSNFHYGQLSKLFRNLFETIDKMITNDEIMQIVNYIYKNDSLTLYPNHNYKELDHATDG